MLLITHRINKVSDLNEIPSNFGIEIDVRDYENNLILQHDPFEKGEDLELFLEHYNHSFLIFNIKSERIEHKIIQLIKKFNILNYFFLDSSIPMIHNLIEKGERNIAIRLSEYESIETVLNFKNKIKYVWVDCFFNFVLNQNNYKLLKENNFQICLVSPELHNREIDIIKHFNIIKNDDLIPDFICTKKNNLNFWSQLIK